MRPPKRLQHIVAATAVALVAVGLASATASARVVQIIGTSGEHKLRYPTDVALGPAGTIYVLDMGDRASDPKMVSVYATSGTLLRRWRAEVRDAAVGEIATDPVGNVYLATSGLPTIVKYSPTGQLLTRWQVPASGDSRHDYAGWITADPRGNLLVAEGNGRLETFDGEGQLLASWPGVGGVAAVDASGMVYVADGRGIVLLDTSGKVARRVAQLSFVSSLAAGPAGTLYAVQTHRIVKLGTDGRFLGSVGGDRRIDWGDAAVAADGSIYVPQWNRLVGPGAVLKLAPITAVDTTPPSVSVDAAAAPSKRLLTRLTYTLSEDSSLRVVIKRRAKTTNRRNRYFGRYLHKLTLDIAMSSAGTHTLAIDWRAAGYQRRAPGSYQLTLVARDDAGNESRPTRVRLSAARR
jgi:hypothetical protein